MNSLRVHSQNNMAPHLVLQQITKEKLFPCNTNMSAVADNIMQCHFVMAQCTTSNAGKTGATAI